MAKNNSNNYITQMISQYGETWVSLVKPEDIQKQARRIAKEMVFNKIDYEKQGIYFLDSKFIDNLIIALQRERDANSLYNDAIGFYRQFYPNIPNIDNFHKEVYSLTWIYNIILYKLELTKSTQNPAHLVDISAYCFNHKNYLR